MNPAPITPKIPFLINFRLFKSNFNPHPKNNKNTNMGLYLRLAIHSISTRIPSPSSAPPNVVLAGL